MVPHIAALRDAGYFKSLRFKYTVLRLCKGCDSFGGQAIPTLSKDKYYISVKKLLTA